jgi:hypothetical protein
LGRVTTPPPDHTAEEAAVPVGGPAGDETDGPASLNQAPIHLRREIDAIERRDFPGDFPAVLTRCIGNYLAGPCVPPAEGEAAWWAGARRQVLRMIDTVMKRRL